MREVDRVLVVICDDQALVRVDLGQATHSALDELLEVVKDVGQQDELLGVEKWRGRVIEQLCALNGDTNARDLVLFVPEFGHLFVQALELLGEFLRTDHGCMLVRILSVLALTHSDGLIHSLTLASQVIANVLAIRQRLEHGKNLELFALPGLKVQGLRVLQVREIGQRVELHHSKAR